MAKQFKLNLYKGSRGGRRPGSGRKRVHSRGVAHRSREKVTSRTPLHINFKYRLLIRNKEKLKLLKKAILNSQRFGLKVLHYSLQSNHVHLIVEATDSKMLTKGMRSITVTMARGIDQGRVQLQRYHLHVLRTVRETRNALSYVLFNDQKHTGKKTVKMDGFSSIVFMKEIKDIVRKKGFTLLWQESKQVNFLSKASSYLYKSGESQLISLKGTAKYH